MKNEQEKSDPSIVAKRPANNPHIAEVDLWGSGAESAEPRETRESNARTGHRAGKACPRGLNVYERLQSKDVSIGMPFMARRLRSVLVRGLSMGFLVQHPSSLRKPTPPSPQHARKYCRVARTARFRPSPLSFSARASDASSARLRAPPLE
jgi:hypothetical protein